MQTHKYIFLYPTIITLILLIVIYQHFRLHHLSMYFGTLHKHSADVTRSDTPFGSNPLHLQVGAFNLLLIWGIHVHAWVLLLLMCSVCQFLLDLLRRYRCAKFIYISRSIIVLIYCEFGTIMAHIPSGKSI